MVSYVDDKIGRLFATLESCGLAGNTVIVFAVDHGEMLGERGMWFKQTFYEWSARVPLFIAAPGIAPRRVAAHVSLVDLLPTLLDLATDGRPPEPVDPLDGSSLVPLMSASGRGAEREVIAEYSAEGAWTASRMLRRGPWKYVYTRGLEPMLYNLDEDPDERRNVAGRADLAAVQSALHERALRGWDPDEIHGRLLASQRRRLFLAEVARRSGRYPNWAYQPFVDESRRFVRAGGGGGPTGAKSKARFPYIEPAKPDRFPD
jgi:choline-sulfatase